MTPGHSHLKIKAVTRSRQIPPCNTKFLETASRNPSAYAATFTITHPLIPSQEGKPATQSPHFQEESNIQISSLERGRGCVTSGHCHLKIKAVTRSRQTPPCNTKFLEATSRNTSAYAATFTVAHPSIPSQEGKPATQSPHFQEESNIQISPLERGGGCVTPGHSHLKIKAVTRSLTSTTPTAIFPLRDRKNKPLTLRFQTHRPRQTNTRKQ